MDYYQSSAVVKHLKLMKGEKAAGIRWSSSKGALADLTAEQVHRQ